MWPLARPDSGVCLPRWTLWWVEPVPTWPRPDVTHAISITNYQKSTTAKSLLLPVSTHCISCLNGFFVPWCVVWMLRWLTQVERDGQNAPGIFRLESGSCLHIFPGRPLLSVLSRLLFQNLVRHPSVCFHAADSQVRLFLFVLIHCSSKHEGFVYSHIILCVFK